MGRQATARWSSTPRPRRRRATRSETRSGSSRAGRIKSSRSRARAVPAGRIARRRDVRRLHAPRGAGSSTRRPARRDLRRGSGGSRRSSSRGHPDAPAADDAGAYRRRRQEDEDIEEFTNIIRYFLLAFAASPCSSALSSSSTRSRYGRPARARVRHAPDDRRLAPANPRLRDPRGARDRAPRLARRALLGARPREGPERALRGAGLDLPTGGTVFTGRTVLVSLLVGVIVTLARRLLPGDPRDEGPADRGGSRGGEPSRSRDGAVHAVDRPGRRSVSRSLLGISMFRRPRHRGALDLARGRRPRALRRRRDGLAKLVKPIVAASAGRARGSRAPASSRANSCEPRSGPRPRRPPS